MTGKLIRAKSERQTFNMQLEKLSMEEKGKGKGIRLVYVKIPLLFGDRN